MVLPESLHRAAWTLGYAATGLCCTDLFAPCTIPFIFLARVFDGKMLQEHPTVIYRRISSVILTEGYRRSAPYDLRNHWMSCHQIGSFRRKKPDRRNQRALTHKFRPFSFLPVAGFRCRSVSDVKLLGRWRSTDPKMPSLHDQERRFGPLWR